MLGTRRGRPSLEGNPVMVVVTVLLAVGVLVFSAYVVTTFPPEAPLLDTAAADGPASAPAAFTAPDGRVR